MKEVDILSVVGRVFSNKKSLIVSVVVGAIAGAVIALSVPKQFTSSVVLAPEMSSGGLGLSDNLADMASSFGIDLSSTGKNMDALYPEIYPEILSSYDFISTLFGVNVRLKEDPTLRTYHKHILMDTKFPFWQYPKIWLSNKMMSQTEKKDLKGTGVADPFRASKIDIDVSKMIAENISCLIDKKTSVILISVTDQDPMVAAIIADTIQSRLQYYITDYRTKKARNDMKYYTKLYNEARSAYLKAQKKYASFCDSNQDVVLESFQAKRDELENDMQSAFTLMSQMSTQVQAAKAKVQERTPAYTMIQSPKMSYKASSMSRAAIVLITIFIAIMINAFWVLFLRDIVRKKKTGAKSESDGDASVSSDEDTDKQ